MAEGPRNRAPPLSLVGRTSLPLRGTGGREENTVQAGPTTHEVDWSILMARAQGGDGMAYRRLLEGVTPFLRSLAARRHRDANEQEDAVQDVLLTVHAIRHTYEPARPFGPWLVAIANRRFVDRLRRQGRIRAREAALTAEHEAFPAQWANIEEISDQHHLAGAIDDLHPVQREAIRLLKLSEMSLKEAAAASGMSVASLKVATHRALKNLRKMLSDRSHK